MIVSSKIRFVQVAYSKSPSRLGLHIMLWPNPPNPPFSEYHGPPKILSAATKKEMEIYIWIFQGGGLFKCKAKAAQQAARPSRDVGQGYNQAGTFCNCIFYFWNSLLAFLERYQLKDPADLLWSKNVTSLTGGSNWRALIQKRHVTNRGVQLTF